ncbi:hypothetical protein [Azospirillum griseum]|uniref:Uncharacterized protein n=1 Tax=Azospirillum griseum TaxID=2496639 RepID=A0A3S0R8Q1_9PROT|nr:hypothetical protein [Azospirillum griseum]RTR19835.1 hypothetical protein EJ903_12605 [Azospirillum griseum]
MQAASTDFAVTKKNGEKVSVVSLVVGDLCILEEGSESIYEVVSKDDDIVVFKSGSEHAAICLNQDISDEWKALLEASTSDAPASDDETIDTVDDDDTEGAGFIKALAKRTIAVIPNKVNPFTGKGILTPVLKVTPINTDLLKTNDPQVAGIAGLQKGDILLKQLKVKLKNWDSVLIAAAQGGLNDSEHSYLGSSTLTHAMIYIGDGKVVEAVRKGVGVTKLNASSSFNDSDYNEYNFYVLRCKHGDVAQKAVDAALELVTTTEPHHAGTEVKVKYNDKELYLGIGFRAAQKFSSKIVFEPLDLITAMGDATNSFIRKLRGGNKPELFCSELVAYCFHVAADKTGRRRFFKSAQQDRIAPEELYVLGREDGTNFTYVGELHQHRR